MIAHLKISISSQSESVARAAEMLAHRCDKPHSPEMPGHMPRLHALSRGSHSDIAYLGRVVCGVRKGGERGESDFDCGNHVVVGEELVVIPFVACDLVSMYVCT